MSTCIFINPNIPDRAEYKQSFSELFLAPTKQIIGADGLKAVEKKTVKELNLLDPETDKGQLNVQSNAADHGNAEADKGNVQSNADQLDQGNLQSIAVTITQERQENRAPKKAKTTHEVQPMQPSASQPFYASHPSQHSHLLCSYELQTSSFIPQLR